MVKKTVAAGAFKQGCLALLDEVSAGGVEVVVTKRGRPVAKVVPVTSAAERDAAILSKLRAATRVLASEKELLRPSSELSPWKVMDVRPGGARRPRGKGK